MDCCSEDGLSNEFPALRRTPKNWRSARRKGETSSSPVNASRSRDCREVQRRWISNTNPNKNAEVRKASQAEREKVTRSAGSPTINTNNEAVRAAGFRYATRSRTRPNARQPPRILGWSLRPYARSNRPPLAITTLIPNWDGLSGSSPRFCKPTERCARNWARATVDSVMA